MTKSLALVLLAALAVAIPATAHVTVNVDPVTAPLAVGVPTNVTVRFSEPCFEMPIELATGNDELTSILDPTAPGYVTGSGQSTAWGIDLCDPTDPLGRVDVGVPLTLVVDATAPGLTNISIPVNYLNANGESGEAALLNLTVAYFANGTLAAGKAEESGHDAPGDAVHAEGQSLHLTLDYTVNAPSLLTFEAVASTGEVHELDAVTVNPPSFTNQSRGELEVNATFEPPANWTAADLTFTAYLTPTVGGPRVQVASTQLTLRNDEAGHDDADDHDADGHTHEEDGNSIPSPAFALLAVALVAIVALRRR